VQRCQIRDDNSGGEESGPQAEQRYVEEQDDEPTVLAREYGIARRAYGTLVDK